MSDQKKSAYGNASSDTSFRRTWDRTEAAAAAAIREQKERIEGKERYEAKLAGKKYVREKTPPDASTTSSRAKRLDVTAQLGKTLLVPASAAVGKRGRGAGFYCQDCDLTFKDNLQWVDHLNSRQHLVSVGESGLVARATLDMVKERLEFLKKRREEEKQGQVVNLGERLAIRKEREDREREAKRQRRKEARRLQKEAEEKRNAPDEDMKDEDNLKMESMMGFGGFVSTKPV
jgi:U4/U6.U5 tri-snRNP component SNU23